MKFYWNIKDHITMIHNLIKYKDYSTYRMPKGKRRFLIEHMWYDGPHYIVDLWFFGICLSTGYAYHVKRNLAEFIHKLIEV
jgi:hypothetical protein